MSEIEEKWSKLWYENHVFEPEVDKNKKKFFVTVPWPYTNGSLHVGHGRTYTLGDIIARYKRLRGYNVLFPMGFHESGTPILAFSERLRNNDVDTVKLYRSYLSEYEKSENIEKIIENFREPENIANYFSRVIIKDFKNLGYSIDWTRNFTSADKFYQEVVKWQFRKLESLGLLKKGEYPILYSINDENAVGEDDIKDGDTDKVTVEEFTGVIFRGRNYDLIAASLRPETLFGVTNLWINPESRYVLIDYKNNKYAMSYDGYAKFSLQHENVKLISDINNDDILHEQFKVPLSDIYVNVIKASFVDPDNGTGIVYSVPGHSIFDYIYFKNNNINGEIKKVVKTNDISVKSLVKKYDLFNNDSKLKEATQELYKEEFYNGTLTNSEKYSDLSVQNARELIKTDLLESNNAVIFYETTRKAVTRSGSKVIVAILKDQWFIDYSQKWLKEKSHDLINSMRFYPELYRKAMNDAIDWLRERPAARKRGIGTKLPFDERWIIESLSDSTIYMVVYTNRNELYNIYNHLNGIDGDILDHIFLDKDLRNKYDNYTMENIIKAKNEFEYWYGNDLRITAPPHISNHLSFYIMNHAAIFSGKYLPGGLMISGLVISNGAKISKSKGNVISLLETVKKYSADIYRLFIAVGADISSLLDWNERDLASIIKKQSSFLNTFENYSDSNEDINNSIYKWFYSSFYKNLKDYFRYMESMNIRDAYISIFYNVLNDLKYVENRGGNINTALKIVMHDWLIALSPVMPYSCEELWHKYVKNSFVSAEHLDFNIDDKIDYNILRSEEYLGRVVNDIREILKIIKNNGNNINLTVYGDKQKIFIENFNNKTLNKQYNIMIKDYIKNKNKIDSNFLDEYNILNANKEFIEKSLNMRVNITKCSEILQKNPWPGRPLIKIE